MLRLNILTPERRLVVDQEIQEVILPGYRGELNILPGHAPLMTTLGTGLLKWRLKSQDTWEKIVISWGYCEVHPNGVDILADVADLAHEVDVEASRRYLSEAEKRLLTEDMEESQREAINRELQRVRADLELVEQNK